MGGLWSDGEDEWREKGLGFGSWFASGATNPNAFDFSIYSLISKIFFFSNFCALNFLKCLIAVQIHVIMYFLFF